MADTYVSLADLTRINDKNAVDLGCSDLYDDAPLLKTLAATVASDGNIHKYIKKTAAPTVGFRAVNAGLANSAVTESAVTVTLQILDGSFTVDKALADAYIKGAGEFVARYARHHLRAVMFAAEKQLVQGTTGGDSAGFTGLADSLTSTANSMVISAAGTTAATGSSIYLIRTNDLGVDCQAVIGQNGNLSMGETIEQRIDDGTGKHYSGYYTSITGWMGLQLGSAVSVARIGSITADSGKGATDTLIAKGLALFPASRQPNLIVMGRRSLQQLQASRTSYSPTGAPAEIPNNAFNIPIVVTDSITPTEALIS